MKQSSLHLDVITALQVKNNIMILIYQSRAVLLVLLDVSAGFSLETLISLSSKVLNWSTSRLKRIISEC